MAKRRPGRPAKAPKDKQSKAIAVRLTPSEWQEVQKRAQTNDLTLSAYLRERGLAS